MLRFNEGTVFAAALGGAIGLATYSMTRNTNTGMMVGFGAGIGFDLVMRLLKRESLIDPDSGGCVGPLPLWIVGLAGFIVWIATQSNNGS